ncbi:O-antigen ligase family protein [Candidatus Microgenomates bacterium]|nr:O-antigen ligase family protein [Candidatus Microgenomates bacterium]
MAYPKQKSLGLHLRGVGIKQLLWFPLFTYLVAFPFGQFTRLPLNFLPGEVSLYLTDLLVGVIGVVGVVWGKNKPTPLDKSFLLFITAALFSLMLASAALTPVQVAISSLYLIRLLFYGLFFSTIHSLIKNGSEKKLVLNSLLVVGIAVSAIGFVQYFLYPDLRALLMLGWDEHINRIVGTFLDPNFTSIILVFTLILMGSHLRGEIGRSMSTPRRWVMGGCLGLLVFTALLLTYSRSGYLAFAASAAAYSIILPSSLRAGKNLRIMILAAVLLAVGIFILPKQTSEGTKLERITSITLRVENLKGGLNLFQQSPVFGVGFNTLRYFRHERGRLAEYGPSHSASGLDNSFLFVLVTTGVVGFITFLKLLREIIRESMGSKGGRVIIIPTIVAVLVHSMFVNSLFYPWVLGWLAVLLAVTLRTGKD